jgi:uncharacterized damage-inducible protein DinB
MQAMAKWFERKFPYAPPADEFPMIVERLRGCAVRLEEKVALTRNRDHLTGRIEDQWSIQEHIGHLIDLEPLWSDRFDEIISGVEVLRAADVTNRETHEGNHNHRDIADLLSEFRTTRGMMVRMLDGFGTAEIESSARHPRLDQRMRSIDLALFVAEHDDHHLSIITRLLRRLNERED